MLRVLKLAMALLLLLTLAGPATAQRLRIIPVPPDVKAQWTPIPELPQVFYAPNIPTDVFRLRGRYYFYWQGAWFQSKKIKGPYFLEKNPPSVLFNIQAAYFKTLPPSPAPPPGEAAVGAPPEEGLVTPEGKPVVPPEPATPPETAQPPEQETPQPPEKQEPAPQAAPEGAMPKAM